MRLVVEGDATVIVGRRAELGDNDIITVVGGTVRLGNSIHHSSPDTPFRGTGRKTLDGMAVWRT